MRSSLFVVAACSVAASLALGTMAGCEDGPTQTFMPAPPDANWNNNGLAPSLVDTTAHGSFVAPVTGGTKVEICPGAVKAMRWAQMVNQPITPPRYAAGLDLAGDDTWIGLTIDQAEQVNCQSDSQGDRFGDGTLVNSWGDNGEVWADYNVTTRKINWLTLWPGYNGALNLKSRDGSHTYQILISQQIKKDNQNFTLDWTGNNGANFIAQGNELYQALLATLAPGLPVEAAGVTCFDVGKCIKGAFGDVAYFYIPSLGFAIWIDNQFANQPVPSVPTRLDVNPAKILPFAFASPVLKMDAQGPIANGGLLGTSKTPCVLSLGQSYSTFLSTCVQVSGVAATDMQALNMLVGGLSHDTERYEFDVAGVDLNFTDAELAPTDIVTDADRPQANDPATEFSADQSTLGPFGNDYDGKGVQDLHGSGAVYKEYLRLSRATLLADRNIDDGPIANCLYPANWKTDPNFTQAAFIASLPPYCTGMEGMITAAPSTGPTDPNNLGVTYSKKVNSAYGLGLKLGHTKVSFCWDAWGLTGLGGIPNGYTQCLSNGDIIATTFAQVLQVYGRGQVGTMPSDVQDVRFFFKMYTTALLKYFTVGSQNPVPDLTNIVLNPDDLFFDSVGAGQFEIAEYVDRRFATKTQAPLDFRFTADVKNGIIDSYDFTRYMYRGDVALYQSMLTDPTDDGIGQEENALLTNIFGSPVIAAGWTAVPAFDMGGNKTAYYCGTVLDPANCGTQTPPLDKNGAVILDELGRPLLQPYPGAFANASTAFTLGTTPIRVTDTYPNIQEAMVRIPLHTNPYDPKSKGLPFLNVMIPWSPMQPGVGFPIALTGTIDKFVETAQLDFSGTTLSANVDYTPIIDPTTMMPMADGSIQLNAVETTDFLGRVFLCQDPITKDLLWARMYTTAADVLNWIETHPGVTDACGIIVRESPFNNYPDYITSLTAGVRLGITQGGGFGRIVDVTLFVPGQ